MTLNCSGLGPTRQVQSRLLMLPNFLASRCTYTEGKGISSDAWQPQ